MTFIFCVILLLQLINIFDGRERHHIFFCYITKTLSVLWNILRCFNALRKKQMAVNVTICHVKRFSRRKSIYARLLGFCLYAKFIMARWLQLAVGWNINPVKLIDISSQINITEMDSFQHRDPLYNQFFLWIIVGESKRITILIEIFGFDIISCKLVGSS